MTGSSFSTLAPLWRDALGGKASMCARQCSRRGGVVRMHIDGDRVVVSGGVAVVVTGTIAY